MKDLEIRGAGNLLGGEQSGHIAGVGFDLYVRLVGEAVAELPRRRRDGGAAEIKVELPVDAHLPHDYVPGERLRLEAYTKLAERRTDEPASTRCSRSCATATARCPPPCRTCWRWPGSATPPGPGVTEVVLRGQNVRFGPAVPARVAGSCGCSACTRVPRSSRR